jgi:hypothetical protein
MRQWVALALFFALVVWVALVQNKPDPATKRRTTVSTEGKSFVINGRPTADLHTRKGDLFGNTGKLLEAMRDWRGKGVLGVAVELQGSDTVFTPTGELRPDPLSRLRRVLDRADELGMVVVLGVFHSGQDEHLQSEEAVKLALDNVAFWLMEESYRNVLLVVASEGGDRFHHDILKSDRVHELIERAQAHHRGDRRLVVGTGCAAAPGEDVLRRPDFLLLHGKPRLPADWKKPQLRVGALSLRGR